MVGEMLAAPPDELTTRLAAFVRRRVPSSSDADDVVQDVLEKILRSDGPTHADRVVPWAFSIAANAVRDHHRRLGRQARRRAAGVSLEELEAGPTGTLEGTSSRRLAISTAPVAGWSEHTAGSANEGEADAAAVTEHVTGALRDLLNKLPAADQHALRAVDLGGMRQSDYAAAQGLSRSGAKSRVQRARRRLRDELERCCRIALDARGGVITCEPKRDPPCCG